VPSKVLIYIVAVLIHTVIPQEKSVAVLDPFNEYRHEFVDSLQSIFNGTITIIDSLTEGTVAGNDALFLFLHSRVVSVNYGEYFISLKECDLLDAYLQQGGNLHLFSEIVIHELYNPVWDTATFWENIGITIAIGNPLSCATDTAQGLPGTFMENELFALRKDEIGWDTTYYGIFNEYIPWIEGECMHVLKNSSSSLDFDISYMYEKNNYRVIIDQFYVISERPYLTKVCEFFNLIPVSIGSGDTDEITVSDQKGILIKHAGNRVYLEVQKIAPHMKTGQITLFDLRGKVIIDRKVNPGELIPLTDFQNGACIVQVKSNQHVFTKKVVFTR
jgi:hypothetical protein